jgi:hypothetical protein
MVRSASQTHDCVFVTTGLPVSFSMRSMTEMVRHLLHGIYTPSTSGCSRNKAVARSWPVSGGSAQITSEFGQPGREMPQPQHRRERESEPAARPGLRGMVSPSPLA